MPQLSLQRPVEGVSFGVAQCGIKRSRPDMALVAFPEGTTAAAVFTQNAMAAAPVHVSRQHVNNDVRALVVNSGNANACTGRQGLRDALEMCRLTADVFDVEPEQVLVASTGVIGQPMPMDKVRAGIADAAGMGGRSSDLATAILTTDSGPKTAETEFDIDGQRHTMQVVTKGSGMIHPNMGTMLSFVFTDAAVEQDTLDAALRAAVATTYNQISVDGDESTNDMAAVFATGDGTKIDVDHPDFPAFQAALTEVCQATAKQIVADGEGATRAIEVCVEGGPDDETARRVARAVVSSSLVKSAVHGADPNWGRIGAAVGQEWRDAPSDWSLWVEAGSDEACLLERGRPLPAETATQIMRAPWLRFRIQFPQGDASGVAWGCDLSPEYVNFNAAYRT